MYKLHIGDLVKAVNFKKSKNSFEDYHTVHNPGKTFYRYGFIAKKEDNKSIVIWDDGSSDIMHDYSLMMIK